MKDKIKNVADNISNYMYADNLEATSQLMELFDSITKNPLSTWRDYVRMYDDNFYTYSTWEELVASETVWKEIVSGTEQSDGLTEEECKEQLNKTIWKLPCGWYVQRV